MILECLNQLIEIHKENPNLPVVHLVRHDEDYHDGSGYYIHDCSYVTVGSYVLYNDRYFMSDDDENLFDEYYEINRVELDEMFNMNETDAMISYVMDKFKNDWTKAIIITV